MVLKLLNDFVAVKLLIAGGVLVELTTGILVDNLVP